MKKTVLILYSGGLDTSICIPMMKEDYDFDHVVTVTVDVGLPEGELKQAEEKAKMLGTEHYSIDARKEFVTDYIFKAIKANGDYQGYPLSTAIARPLIMAKTVEITKKTGAQAFCHGCTGKGNDQFRFEFVMRYFMPEMPIIAPMREHTLTRSWEIEYAEKRGIPIGQSKEKIWSIDENLWGRSIEGGRLEDPNYAPPEDIFKWTKSIADANDTPQDVTITFENGVPVAIDNNKLEPLELIQLAHKIAGDNGVGRIDMMEDRIIGMKVRENYECPAAKILIPAHRALEDLVCTREERAFKKIVDQTWSNLAYEGLWFDPFKEDLEAFINNIQPRVTGTVTLRLYKGSCIVVGRASKYALYSEDLASFDSKTFDQSDIGGILKVHGLQARMFKTVMDK